MIYAETMLVGISRRVHDQSATVESVDRSADWLAWSGVPRDSAFRDASMSCSVLAAVSRTLSVDATRECYVYSCVCVLCVLCVRMNTRVDIPRHECVGACVGRWNDRGRRKGGMKSDREIDTEDYKDRIGMDKPRKRGIERGNEA